MEPGRTCGEETVCRRQYRGHFLEKALAPRWFLVVHVLLCGYVKLGEIFGKGPLYLCGGYLHTFTTCGVAS